MKQKRGAHARDGEKESKLKKHRKNKQMSKLKKGKIERRKENVQGG